ncbi:hypothetical protein QTG56_24080 (plasmid) [Rossellomorea sp. AcN35-11]|nr:hypothetical protein [Rossellomorea aquimaris]WJV31718.1 hypothetical protein QTG56_24080 [Rossellomorea sp. AcN35-11]
MTHLLKEKRTEQDLKTYLKDKTDDYVLEQYALSRIAFEEDVKKGRYSEHAENVRAVLKLCILRRMAGLEKHQS